MPVRLLPVGTVATLACAWCFSFFLPMVSMEETPWGSHPGLNESKNFLSFNWTDSTSLRLAKQDPFACAMLDELDEGSVGLSREQSSSSEGLLFSDSDEVAESEDEGMTTKKVCGEEEDIVPCSQPDSDVEICPNDISPQEDRVDVTKELNRSGRPVRAASLGVGQYLVAARAAAASHACVEAGPRGARTDRQRRALSQTAMRRAMTDVQPYDRKEAVPQSATQPAPLTSASLLLHKYVADFEKLPLRFLQCKDRNMTTAGTQVSPGPGGTGGNTTEEKGGTGGHPKAERRGKGGQAKAGSEAEGRSRTVG